MQVRWARTNVVINFTAFRGSRVDDLYVHVHECKKSQRLYEWFQHTADDIGFRNSHRLRSQRVGGFRIRIIAAAIAVTMSTG